MTLTVASKTCNSNYSHPVQYMQRDCSCCIVGCAQKYATVFTTGQKIFVLFYSHVISFIHHVCFVLCTNLIQKEKQFYKMPKISAIKIHNAFLH